MGIYAAQTNAEAWYVLILASRLEHHAIKMRSLLQSVLRSSGQAISLGRINVFQDSHV